MQPQNTNTPQPEPKKSFWAKLFGGKKNNSTTTGTPPVYTNPLPQQTTEPQSGFDPAVSSNPVDPVSVSDPIQPVPDAPVETPVDNFGTASASSSLPSEQVSPAEEAAVNQALNSLEVPQTASQQEYTAPPAPSGPAGPTEAAVPTPPSDPMVTPIPGPTSAVPEAVYTAPAPQSPSATTFEPSASAQFPQQAPQSSPQDDIDSRPPLSPPSR